MNNRIDLAIFAKFGKTFEEQSLLDDLKISGLQEQIKGKGLLKKEQNVTPAFNASRWRDKKNDEAGAKRIIL